MRTHTGMAMASMANFPRRALESLGERGRRLGIGALALILLGLVVFAVLEGDIPELFGRGAHVVAPLLHRFGVGAAFALLYLEESGVPMPLPGDVFVMYVGHRSGTSPALVVAAWLGLVSTVVLGASNLYYVSRRWGRSLVDRRLGKILELTPATIERAERWFERWGFWTLVVGRHVPGLRVPLTVAAGVFRVRYSVFVASVALSTGLWAAFFMTLGIAFGGRVGHFLQIHREGYVLLPLAIIVAFGVYLFAVRRRVASLPPPA